MTYQDDQLASPIFVVSDTDEALVVRARRPKLGGGPRKDYVFRKTDGGCWEAINRPAGSNGYVCYSDGQTKAPVHRVVYEYFVGPVPDGRILMHSCDNRICVNPDHLSPGTHYENIRDRTLRGRSRTKLTIPEVKAIVGLLDLFTHKEIADKYGVDASTISNIRTGRSWNAVTGLRENPRLAQKGKARTRQYVYKTKPAEAVA